MKTIKINPINLFLFTLASFFTFFMHIYINNTGGEGLQLPFNAITLIFISLLTLIGTISLSNKVKFDNFYLALFVFILITSIPYLWSDFYQGLSQAPRQYFLLILALFYLSIIQLGDRKSFYLKLLLLVCLSCIIESLLSLYQFYLYNPNFYHFDLSYGRPYGVFQQPNVLSTYLSSGISISLFILSFYKNLPKKIKFTLHSNIFLSIWVILLCQSRVGILTLLVIFCYYLLSRKVSSTIKSTLVLTTLLSLTLALMLPYVGNEEDTGRKNSVYSNSRSTLYTETLKVIISSPLTGHGYGSFHNQIIEKAATSIPKNVRNSSSVENVAHPHNEFLYWYAEGGILTLLALTFLVFIICNIILKCKKKIRCGLLLLLLPIAIHTQVEMPFYHSLPHAVITLILIAFINSNNKQIKETHNRKLISFIKISSLTGLVITTIYSLSAVQSTYNLYNYVAKNNILYLNRVSNPLPDFKNINILKKSIEVENSLRTKNYNEIKHILEWTDSFLSVYPSPYIRFERIRLLKALNMKKQANIETEKANELYPQYLRTWESGVWDPN